MSTTIRSLRQYARTLEIIRCLKQDLLHLADQKGNLDPEVVALSQEIDDYIVQVQRFQHRTSDSEVC